MASGPPAKRFAHFSEKELEEKALSVQKKNTLRNEEKAVRAFKEYLSEVEAPTDFFVFNEPELDSYLSKFWFCLRKKKKTNHDNSDHYRVSSMYTMRHSLNRALKRYGHEFDITKKSCTSFTKSIKAFEDAIAELKKMGKGYVINYPEIPDSGNCYIFYNVKLMCDYNLIAN